MLVFFGMIQFPERCLGLFKVTFSQSGGEQEGIGCKSRLSLSCTCLRSTVYVYCIKF